MKTSKPPFIAAWLLDRLGADPQIQTIAGDLLEQYRMGRSRLWYWHEVITAILLGTWSEFRNHGLSVIRGLAVGWIITYITVWIVGPFAYSILAPYAYLIFPLHDLDARFPNIMEFVVGTLRGAPWCVLTGWVVGRFAPECRIPAVLGFAMSFLLFGVLGNTILMITQGIDPFLPWMSVPGLTLLTIFILCGGGLFTGSPKHSVSTHS